MNESSRGNFKSYTIGFISSIVLTLVAYILVVNKVWSNNTIIAVIIILAVLQLFVQLIFFLHLGRESKPRWNLTVASFAAIVVGVLVIGSLWIMQNLNYGHQHGHSETPEQTNHYIIKDELIKN